MQPRAGFSILKLTSKTNIQTFLVGFGKKGFCLLLYDTFFGRVLSVLTIGLINTIIILSRLFLPTI